MELNKYIEYSNLNSKITLKDIEKTCNEAIEYGFVSVYVYPYYVSLVSQLLKDTNIEVSTVIGNSLGLNNLEVKAYEAINAMENGAKEITLISNISAIKNHDYEYVKEEIEEIRDTIDGKELTVMIDPALLTKEEFIKIVNICNETFINYIKIPINKKDINLINEHKNDLLKIAVYGNNLDLLLVNDLIDMGINKIETSDGIKLMEE